MTSPESGIKIIIIYILVIQFLMKFYNSFKANESGLEYQAAICTSVPENNENATIVVTNSSKPVIFGRRNRTVITGGGKVSYFIASNIKN